MHLPSRPATTPRTHHPYPQHHNLSPHLISPLHPIYNQVHRAGRAEHGRVGSMTWEVGPEMLNEGQLGHESFSNGKSPYHEQTGHFGFHNAAPEQHGPPAAPHAWADEANQHPSARQRSRKWTHLVPFSSFVN